MTISCIFGENKRTGLDEQYAIDPDFKSMVISTTETYAKHIGVFFLLTGKITALAAGASARFLARIPAGFEVHVGKMVVDSSSAPLELMLYSAPTVTAPGTPMTPVNANQRLNYPSALLVYSAPTISVNGDLINFSLVAGTKQVGGRGEGAFDELILAPSRDYMFVITNTSTGAADIGYDIEWVEQPITS